MVTGRGKKIALGAGGVLFASLVLTGILFRREFQAWYVFWREFDGLGRNTQGYAEYRHVETGIVFVKVPGGRFVMGSPETEAGRRPDEGPAHEVTLSPFLIAKCEVSHSEWKTIMGTDPSFLKGGPLPVAEISWEECRYFCKSAGLSLPTEAQWEYACRAGMSGPVAGMGNLDEMGWHHMNSKGRTHPVGTREPNDFGLHDMCGNVHEWCEDWFQRDFYEETAGAKDPLCENSDSGSRVVRGGGWNLHKKYNRSANRFRRRPSGRYDNVGFRPAFPSP